MELYIFFKEIIYVNLNFFVTIEKVNLTTKQIKTVEQTTKTMRLPDVFQESIL